MSEGEREGGREREKLRVGRGICVLQILDLIKIHLQAYQMGLTTENHVWMFPAWYRPDWYQEDYKLPNGTLLCTKDQVCFNVFSLIPIVIGTFYSALSGLPKLIVLV